MNSCMIIHATQQEQDAARAEWFATADERQREREEKEKKKAEQERFYRYIFPCSLSGDSAN